MQSRYGTTSEEAIVNMHIDNGPMETGKGPRDTEKEVTLKGDPFYPSTCVRILKW